VFNATSQEKVIIKVTKHILFEIALTDVALAIPGRHLLLIGSDGSGRCSLVRFVAHMHEYNFVNLAEPSPEEILVPEDRFAALSALFPDIVVTACIHQRKASFSCGRANETHRKLK
jgi:predicted AAA+ superfamily ATPase